MTKKNPMSKALVRRETIAGYAFMFPSLIFFLGFVVYPMIQCIYTSFFDSTMNRDDIFIGLTNYKELFQDAIFLGALKNTAIIVLVSVPVVCIFSLWASSVIYNLKGPVCSTFQAPQRRCSFFVSAQVLPNGIPLSLLSPYSLPVSRLFFCCFLTDPPLRPGLSPSRRAEKRPPVYKNRWPFLIL